MAVPRSLNGRIVRSRIQVAYMAHSRCVRELACQRVVAQLPQHAQLHLRAVGRRLASFEAVIPEEQISDSKKGTQDKCALPLCSAVC